MRKALLATLVLTASSAAAQRVVGLDQVPPGAKCEQSAILNGFIGKPASVDLAARLMTAARAPKLRWVAAGQSVRIELMADCFAGIWANRANRKQKIVEAGDIDEALTAAAAIGDDRLQKQAQGYAVPDSFTHGTSAQRVHWFKVGYQRGEVAWR